MFEFLFVCRDDRRGSNNGSGSCYEEDVAPWHGVSLKGRFGVPADRAFFIRRCLLSSGIGRRIEANARVINLVICRCRGLPSRFELSVSLLFLEGVWLVCDRLEDSEFFLSGIRIVAI